MQWVDEGYLLSKNKYSENSIIIEVFTLNHGKCSGIVYGGTSRKIKNYLQLGNKIHISLKAKNINSLGYFKVEILEAISPFFFDNDKKINCLFSAINILKTVVPELLSYNVIYVLFSDFLNKLKFSNNWIVHYIFWEINILKEVGFDMNLNSNIVSSKNNNNNLVSVILDDENINIPSFLLEKSSNNIDNKFIYLALKFIGKYYEKNILIPNNLNFHIARRKLENYFDVK